jgi:hypothetical protein
MMYSAFSINALSSRYNGLSPQFGVDLNARREAKSEQGRVISENAAREIQNARLERAAQEQADAEAVENRAVKQATAVLRTYTQKASTGVSVKDILAELVRLYNKKEDSNALQRNSRSSLKFVDYQNPDPTVREIDFLKKGDTFQTNEEIALARVALTLFETQGLITVSNGMFRLIDVQPRAVKVLEALG